MSSPQKPASSPAHGDQTTPSLGGGGQGNGQGGGIFWGPGGKRLGKNQRKRAMRKAAEEAAATIAAGVAEGVSGPPMAPNPPQHDPKDAGDQQPDTPDDRLDEANQQLRRYEKEVEEQRGQLVGYEDQLAELGAFQKAAEERAARAKKEVEALERSLSETEDKLCAAQKGEAGLAEELRGAKTTMAALAKAKKRMEEKDLPKKDEEIESLQVRIEALKRNHAREVERVEEQRATLQTDLDNSTLEQENEVLQTDLAKSEAELGRMNQNLKDAEAELKEERRRLRCYQEMHKTRKGHVRLSLELAKLEGGVCGNEGEGDINGVKDGQTDAGSPTKERCPLVVFKKRGASIPPSLSRARLATSTGVQIDNLSASAVALVNPVTIFSVAPILPQTKKAYRTEIGTQTDADTTAPMPQGGPAPITSHDVRNPSEVLATEDSTDFDLALTIPLPDDPQNDEASIAGNGIAISRPTYLLSSSGPQNNELPSAEIARQTDRDPTSLSRQGLSQVCEAADNGTLKNRDPTSRSSTISPEVDSQADRSPIGISFPQFLPENASAENGMRKGRDPTSRDPTKFPKDDKLPIADTDSLAVRAPTAQSPPETPLLNDAVASANNGTPMDRDPTSRRPRSALEKAKASSTRDGTKKKKKPSNTSSKSRRNPPVLTVAHYTGESTAPTPPRNSAPPRPPFLAGLDRIKPLDKKIYRPPFGLQTSRLNLPYPPRKAKPSVAEIDTQTDQAPTAGGPAQENDVSAAGTGETDEAHEKEDTEVQAEASVVVRQSTTASRISFLLLMWLVSALFLVCLGGREQREWHRANGQSALKFLDVLDDILPPNPMVELIGVSLVNPDIYRTHMMG